jgi:hypothetical protein
MSISATSRITATSPHHMRRAGDYVVQQATSSTPAADSVAVVQVEAPLRARPASSMTARPDAAFLAHLIATAEQAPQTRVLRRADLADVEAAYRAAKNVGTSSGLLRRTA